MNNYPESIALADVQYPMKILEKWGYSMKNPINLAWCHVADGVHIINRPKDVLQ